MFAKPLIALLLGLMVVAPAYAAEKEETVVLLHGIAKSGVDLLPVHYSLQKQGGYKTLIITYPSQERGLDDIAQYLRQ